MFDVQLLRPSIFERDVAVPVLIESCIQCVHTVTNLEGLELIACDPHVLLDALDDVQIAGIRAFDGLPMGIELALASNHFLAIQLHAFPPQPLNAPGLRIGRCLPRCFASTGRVLLLMLRVAFSPIRTLRFRWQLCRRIVRSLLAGAKIS